MSIYDNDDHFSCHLKNVCTHRNNRVDAAAQPKGFID
ncbi:Uncharacterised protein [Burkholderia pseudomallei]|nr:Uncharacterised protein [Burkholderia pseudomallei]CAJ3816986.1 Uncharacterised protein [Burkholderia pseudomallei]CAJ3821540.1 Uncharacterised protein [Burkholderia pseudomallei]CAJ4199787.1 Uncharacterised protein [Burkholderia pseudomallei]CAJ4313774.1 Uncharacterised protein [Burkholderia pseudomallei]